MEKDPKTAKFISELIDLDVRRVQQLAKEGIIPAVSTRPYKFDLIPTVNAYVGYLRKCAEGRGPRTAEAEKAEDDKLRAEADLKQSKAKIERLKLRELENKMHRSEDVEAMTNDLVYTVRSMIMALPGRLAMDVVEAESANEASALIRSECYKILNELANYEYDPEAYRRRVMDRAGWSESPPDESDE